LRIFHETRFSAYLDAEVPTGEHVGDSDDGDSGGTPDEVEAIAPVESHPPRRLFRAAGNVKVQRNV